jgi:hypothetical protein
MRQKVAVLGLAAVMVFGACGDDEDSASSTTTVAPATTTTLSQVQLDKAKAQRIVLSATDLPGYTQDPPDPGADSPEFEAAANACVNNNPLIVALGTDTDPRGAVSPDFSKGDTVTVTSSVTFGDTEDAARSVMTDLNAASFPACFSRAFTTELRKDTTNSNVSVTTTKLPALNVGDQSVAYRTVARFRTQNTNIVLNVDFTFVRVGRAFGSIQDLQATTPFPDAERLRLATALAGRMAAP